MRIHTSLDRQVMFGAASVAGVRIEEISQHGSRKRDHAFEIKLSGSSRYAAQGGQWKAATWDEWGVFLMFILDRDPIAVCGQYNGRADFLRQTREAVEGARNYERIVGRKRPGMTGPWLFPLAGESNEAFKAATA